MNWIYEVLLGIAGSSLYLVLFVFSCIDWICKPYGNCPIQAEGYFNGKYFYFRSRWNRATIEFAKTSLHWENDHTIRGYTLYTLEAPKAGWISKRMCYLLIFKGCLKFMFRFKSTL